MRRCSRGASARLCATSARTRDATGAGPPPSSGRPRATARILSSPRAPAVAAGDGPRSTWNTPDGACLSRWRRVAAKKRKQPSPGVLVDDDPESASVGGCPDLAAGRSDDRLFELGGHGAVIGVRLRPRRCWPWAMSDLCLERAHRPAGFGRATSEPAPAVGCGRSLRAALSRALCSGRRSRSARSRRPGARASGRCSRCRRGCGPVASLARWRSVADHRAGWPGFLPARSG
jgi:hypothetical protein